jgi:hypothetical protein
VIGKTLFICAVSALALPLIHPFGPVRDNRSTAALPDMPLLRRSCQNCHSERTEWPLYSYLPGAGWLVEKDVADARMNMNLSRWAQYSIDERMGLLASIAAEVRSHQMPPARYTFLHPQAHLSDDDIQQIYEWTKRQRNILRAEGINHALAESSSMPQ